MEKAAKVVHGDAGAGQDGVDPQAGAGQHGGGHARVDGAHRHLLGGHTHRRTHDGAVAVDHKEQLVDPLRVGRQVDGVGRVGQEDAATRAEAAGILILVEQDIGGGAERRGGGKINRMVRFWLAGTAPAPVSVTT